MSPCPSDHESVNRVAPSSGVSPSRVPADRPHSIDPRKTLPTGLAREPGKLIEHLLHLSFIVLFALASPIYYLNRWDFKRNLRRNPLFTSRLVKLQARIPLLYELAMVVQNFPSTRVVYRILPPLSGDVLQVGCGTGLLNRCLGDSTDLRLVNLDTNLNALKLGMRLGRFKDFVHASIDRRVPFPDGSFDAIVFARCLHHVRKHRAAFEECARLLRPGGRLIILAPVTLDDVEGAPANGFMGNSSIDGVIWRFSRTSFLTNLNKNMPPSMSLTQIEFIRQPHVTNFNLFEIGRAHV